MDKQKGSVAALFFCFKHSSKCNRLVCLAKCSETVLVRRNVSLQGPNPPYLPYSGFTLPSPVLPSCLVLPCPPPNPPFQSYPPLPGPTLQFPVIRKTLPHELAIMRLMKKSMTKHTAAFTLLYHTIPYSTLPYLALRLPRITLPQIMRFIKRVETGRHRSSSQTSSLQAPSSTSRHARESVCFATYQPNHRWFTPPHSRFWGHRGRGAQSFRLVIHAPADFGLALIICCT